MGDCRDFLHPDEKGGTIVYAIDASSANKERKTGVEWYAFHLIEAMKHHTLSKEECVILLSPTPLQGALSKLPSQWESRVLSWPFARGWMKGRVSLEIGKHPPHVLFVPAQGLPIMLPLRAHRPSFVITTVHDIGFLRRPDVYDPATRRRLRSVTKRACRLSSHLLTVSDFTKREVMDAYHVPEDHITVTPLATDTQMSIPSEEEKMSVLQTYRLSPHFFFSVGRLEAKKNLLTLVRAFEQFKERRGQGDPFELVLAGFPGYRAQEIETFAKASPFQSSIRFLGYVEEAHVSTLMSQATAYMTPSWYEGFGIPNLEAASCGTPVIASDISAHREVMGETALFVPPADVEAWARAMERVVDDVALRSSLAQKGMERAKQFSWDKTAQKTWEVLRTSHPS